MNRKSFLKKSSMIGCMLGPLYPYANAFSLPFNEKLFPGRYWQGYEDGRVNCQLCPNECIIQPNEDGDCHARGNRNGKLYSLVYSLPSVIHLDEIGKSPLYHYHLPGKAFSIATAGCNLTCSFCQNHEISQQGPDKVKTFQLTPTEVVKRAKDNGINAINFFYTEPTVYFEYMVDIATLAKKEGMKTFCITAGYIHPEPLKEILPLTDAFVFGLKGFDNDFYSQYIGCDLQPILNSLEIILQYDKTWTEIVNLIIPGLNDDMTKVSNMCKWIQERTDGNTPLHFTKFEPYYLLSDVAPTPRTTLEKAYQTGKENGLKYVYLGNIAGHEGNNTICPECNKVLIERVNYETISNKISNNKCTCGNLIHGVWK